MAAITRHWSTVLNGIQTDEGKFRGEVAKIIAHVKQASTSKKPADKPIAVTNGQTALADITQSLGYAPDFLARFPEVARAGAWRQMRDVQLNPSTVMSGKNKELVGLAVASQVPCRFCVIAHTEFAKLNGATDAEITEAVAMASLTRDLSTLLNGMQVDETQFRKDVEQLVKRVTAAAATNSTSKNTASKNNHTATR
ncbi:MAG: carboxymuconolactone decarboxylase family protein [Deltaproteobacteria bacterium]|nr:carboxymuconolactone decarboxylase family protein [Deltaproteobacteria bacterium]